jgi:tRNA-dihydrouridine synthase
MNKPTLYIAPFQGVTTDVFLDVYSRFFPGIDKMFTAFFSSVQNSKRLSDKVHKLELNKINNIKVVPQILSKESAEIVRFASICKDYGYDEINWNLGCPFKRVAMKKRGSGLLPYPDEVNEILKEVFEKTDIKLSVKCRLGYFSSSEIFDLLPVFNKYDIYELIVHARIGKQLYSGTVDTVTFGKIYGNTKAKLCYNGDIFSKEDFLNFENRFPALNTWMVGRGLLSNPFLPAEIKNINPQTNKRETLRRFVDELYYRYRKETNDGLQSINKMKELWSYLSQSFDNPPRVFGIIKKTKTFDQYEDAVKRVFDEQESKVFY